MSNRAQRRAIMRKQTQKNKGLIADYSKQERLKGLIQNGITPEDLQREYERGREDGFREAGMPIIKSCYAGICAALHDEFGFGEDRCFRAIKAVDEKVLWALNNQELVDEVLEKTGLRLDFGDNFDRVQKTGQARKTGVSRA